jgi:hypothetical protein
VRFADVANRLTGFSTPIFGVSWTPAILDREAAQQVIVFLEDRRMLYVPYVAENPDWCVQSALQIRAFLTELLGRGGIAVDLADHLRAIRAACRHFVSTVEGIDAREKEYGQYVFKEWAFNQALGEFRAIVGVHVAQIAVSHGIDVPDDLTVILPPTTAIDP